jgi:hypothetical protein
VLTERMPFVTRTDWQWTIYTQTIYLEAGVSVHRHTHDVTLSEGYYIFWPMVYSKGPHIFKTSRSHPQILGAKRMRSSRFSIEDSQFRCALLALP